MHGEDIWSNRGWKDTFSVMCVCVFLYSYPCEDHCLQSEDIWPPFMSGFREGWDLNMSSVPMTGNKNVISNVILVRQYMFSYVAFGLP